MELQALRERYAWLRAQNRALAEEGSAGEQLLGRMSKTSFDLRVGAQALDAHEVKPLEQCVAGVTQWHRDLAQLQHRARGEAAWQ